jgi:hypothetical protein
VRERRRRERVKRTKNIKESFSSKFELATAQRPT